ncbi:MAG TPA: hypothetical protein VFM18_10915 [Methanosarcina sp.]|nr:hypothetical protein [Methanosarcina sp.]
MTDVKDWRSNSRVSKNAIPNVESKCSFSSCPHLVDGKCPNPRDNKKHVDSICHKIGNKNFVSMFHAGD